MMQPPSGEWLYLDTLVTNSSGRVSYTIPETHRLGVGVYPVKMVVRYVPLRGAQAEADYCGQAGGALVGSDELSPTGETTHLQTATSPCCPRARSSWSSVSMAPLLPACPSWAVTPKCEPGPWMWCGEWPRGRSGRAWRPGGEALGCQSRGHGAGTLGLEKLAPPLTSCVTSCC